MKTVYGYELKLSGGKWLATAREWMQQHCWNGSDVFWSSVTPLKPQMTVTAVEELAAEVAASVLTENGILTKNDPANVRWENLREGFLKNIKAIDNDTPWQETEPKWWLEMREIEQMLLNQCNHKKD